MKKTWIYVIIIQILFFYNEDLKPDVRLSDSRRLTKSDSEFSNVSSSYFGKSQSCDNFFDLSLNPSLNKRGTYYPIHFANRISYLENLNPDVRLSDSRSLTESNSEFSNVSSSYFGKSQSCDNFFDLSLNPSLNKRGTFCPIHFSNRISYLEDLISDVRLSASRSLTESDSEFSNVKSSHSHNISSTKGDSSHFNELTAKNKFSPEFNKLSLTIGIRDTIKSNNTYYIFKRRQLTTINPIEFKPEKRKIYYDRLFLVTAITSASVATVHHYQSKAWWQATRTKFHFQNDWEYALWIDKLGHWWGATAIHHLFSSALRWSNFSDVSSMWLSSFMALTYQLYIETYDGYARDWGFSPGDALFDFGGAFYPLLQYYYPPLKNVNLKLSYYPSKRLLKKDPNDELYKNKFVIDDYEGQSFYLSFKINNILPDNLEKLWPDFLCLAIGYEMRNWNGYAVADKNYFLTLDYDFEQVPLYGQFWQFLKNTFNLIHFPAPGIRFSNGKISLTIAY